MKKPISRIATIHDLCGVGKAALTNVIPVLSIMKIEVCPIPTMILSTHTGGFGSPEIIKCDGYIEKAFNHYKSIDMDFDGIFIGYLGSLENVKATLKFLKSNDIDKQLVILDPIFGDNGSYYKNFNKEYSDSLKELIKYSKVITPNYTESCILCDEIIKESITNDDILTLSRKLYSLGWKDVIITSLPLKDRKKIGTSIYYGKEDRITLIENERIEKSYPGTGDLFTAVLSGYLVNNVSLLEGVERACEFVSYCINKSSEYDYPTKEGVLLEYCLEELFKHTHKHS